MILFRPVGIRELRLIAETEFRAFPPRLPEQPVFYPVLTENYAKKIAQEWNTVDELSGYIGVVTGFEMDDFVGRYPVRYAGGRSHSELWVPAEDLLAFNAHIVGRITVVGVYLGPKASEEDRSFVTSSVPTV